MSTSPWRGRLEEESLRMSRLRNRLEEIRSSSSLEDDTTTGRSSAHNGGGASFSSAPPSSSRNEDGTDETSLPKKVPLDHSRNDDHSSHTTWAGTTEPGRGREELLRQTHHSSESNRTDSSATADARGHRLTKIASKNLASILAADDDDDDDDGEKGVVGQATKSGGDGDGGDGDVANFPTTSTPNDARRRQQDYWMKSPNRLEHISQLTETTYTHDDHHQVDELVSPLTAMGVPVLLEGRNNSNSSNTNGRSSSHQKNPPLPIYNDDDGEDRNHRDKQPLANTNNAREPTHNPSTTSNSVGAPGPGAITLDPVQRKLQQHEQELQSGGGSYSRRAARRSRLQQQATTTPTMPSAVPGPQQAAAGYHHQQLQHPSTRSVVSNISNDSFMTSGGGSRTSFGSNLSIDEDVVFEGGRKSTPSTASAAQTPDSSSTNTRERDLQRKLLEEADGNGNSNQQRKRPARASSQDVNGDNNNNRDQDLQRKLEQEEQERAIAAGVSHGQLDSETVEERLERKLQEESRQRDNADARGHPVSSATASSAHHHHHEGTYKQQQQQHRPGAISVPGPEAERSSSHRRVGEGCRGSDQRSSAMMARQESSKRVLAVAAVVVEDYESEQLSEKQRELQEKEAMLATKMAQLQAWEEELERKRRDLEGRSIVQAEVVSADTSASGSASGGGGWNIFSGRVSSTEEDKYIEEDEFVSMPFDLGSKSSGVVDFQLAEMEIGPGPMRFAPRNEIPLEEQLTALCTKDRRSYRNMKQRLDDYKAKHVASSGGNKKRSKKQQILDFSVEWQLRFLRHYTAKDGLFHEDHAYKAIINLQIRFMNLRVYPLLRQLQSKTLFPVPGLRTKDGHDMFYMRPSRYFPGETTARTIIDNLCYVMNTILEKEHAQTEGIGFIACMDGWKMRNFDVNYCYQFMMALQGVMIPVKTQLFLIVNPPIWFASVWSIMKPMLVPSFRKRVKICPEKKISKYLEDGYEHFLPDDMASGRANTDAMVQDFIVYRQYAEKHEALGSVASVSDDDGASSSQYSDNLSLHHDNFMDHQGRSNYRSIEPEFSDAISQNIMGAASSVAGTNTSGEASILCEIDGEDDDDASIGCDIDQVDHDDHDDDAKPSALSSRQTRSKPSSDEQLAFETAAVAEAKLVPVGVKPPMASRRPPLYYLGQLFGPGPLRFAPGGERDLEEELFDLSVPDKRAYKNLKQRWIDYCAKQQSYGGRNKKRETAPAEIPMEWYFRFLYDTAKKDGHFHEDLAFRSMMKLLPNDFFLKLRVFPLTKQLRSKTLFPVPGLKTKIGGHDMFYMRPSRFFPKETSTSIIINNLAYVINTLCEKQHAKKEGVGFIACMDDWKMVNFDVKYCYQFMMALQGAMVPIKVELFLIVNPPIWFSSIWAVMKPMLAPGFRKKVKICKESKISKYLEEGYEQFLPDDMQTGRVATTELVDDFIEYRKYVERNDIGKGEADEDDDISTNQYSDVSSSNNSGWKGPHKFSHASSSFSDTMSNSAAANSHDDEDGASIDAELDNQWELMDSSAGL